MVCTWLALFALLASMNANARKAVPQRKQFKTNTYIHTYMLLLPNTHIHTYIHAYIHTSYMNTYIHKADLVAKCTERKRKRERERARVRTKRRVVAFFAVDV